MDKTLFFREVERLMPRFCLWQRVTVSNRGLRLGIFSMFSGQFSGQSTCFLPPSHHPPPCGTVGEVCFYLKKTREQFRIKGRLQVVDAGESDEVLAKARRHQWTLISPAAQGSFATSLIPGSEIPPGLETPPSEGGGDSVSDKSTAEGRSNRPRGRGGGNSEDTENADGSGDVVEPSKELAVSEDFCLVLMWPNFVDHLQLGEVQLRNVHKIKGDRDGGGIVLGTRTVKVEDGPGGRQPESPDVAWVTMGVNP